MRVGDVIKLYVASWGFAIKAWPFIVLLWVVNLIITLILIGPINYGLERAFGNSLNLSTLMGSFNYTLTMDFLREYDGVVGTAFDQSIVIILVSILVQVFLTGGIIHLVSANNDMIKFRAFWSSCGSYFFKYLGLSVLLIFITTIFSFLLFSFFSKDGFNPFFLENEWVLIYRFRWLVAMGLLFLFWLSVYRDAAKIEIFNNHDYGYWKGLYLGLKKSFSLSYLMNGILNAVVFILFLCAFFLLRSNLVLFGWTLIIISQLWLVFRIAYRVGRLRSFACLRFSSNDYST